MFTLQLHSFQTAGHQSKLMLCWAISREKTNREIEDILFWNPLEFLGFLFTLPPVNFKQTRLPARKSTKLRCNPSEFLSLKQKDPWWGNSTICLFLPQGNSMLFFSLENPLIFSITPVEIPYPHLNPPFSICFFLNSPYWPNYLIALVKETKNTGLSINQKEDTTNSWLLVLVVRKILLLLACGKKWPPKRN